MAARCVTEAFSTTCAVHIEDCESWSVADLGGGGGGGGGVRGVQMHPPLAASNVFLRTARVHQMIVQQLHSATPGS